MNVASGTRLADGTNAEGSAYAIPHEAGEHQSGAERHNSDGAAAQPYDGQVAHGEAYPERHVLPASAIPADDDMALAMQADEHTSETVRGTRQRAGSG